MYGEFPVGLNQVKLVEFVSGSSVAGSAVLAAAQTLKFSESIASNELKGNDTTVAIVSQLDKLEWELEAGGIPLDAYAIITGRSASASGLTPNRTTTMQAIGGGSYPYFRIYGKALGQDTDDVHLKLFKSKVSSLEGELKGGEFLVTKCKGTAVADSGSTPTNMIFEIVQNETAAALP